MAKNSIKKNYLYNVVYQIMIILIPIITTPYLSRVLGVRGIGEQSYVASIASYFVLVATLGSDSYGRREIGISQDDKEEYSRTFFEILFLRFITGCIAVAGYLIVIMHVGSHRGLFVIYTLNIVATIVDITWFFQGMEDFKQVVVRNIIVRLVQVVLLFTMIKDETDLGRYCLLFLMCTLVGNLSIWLYLPKYLVKIRRIRPFKHLKGTIALFIPTIAFQVYTVLDKTMIGLFASTAVENGVYEQAEKIVRMGTTVITSIVVVMIPRIANAFAKEDHEKVNEYMKNTIHFVWLIGLPMAVGIMTISDYFTNVFFGSGYEKVSILLRILAPMIISIGLGAVIGSQYLITVRRQKAYNTIVILGSCVNLILNIILIPRFFSIGAAIASAGAETFIAIMDIAYVYQNRMLSFDGWFQIRKFVVSATIMGIFVFLVTQYIPQSFAFLFMVLVCAVFIYFGILFLEHESIVESNVRKYIVRITGILKRRKENA